MSEHVPTLDTHARFESYRGIAEPHPGWLLKLFVISVDAEVPKEAEGILTLLGQLVESLEERLSSEFTYARFGFAIVHFGRRGTCITIRHFGAWGATFEVFATSWYRYVGQSGAFALLNDVEPEMCWFEIDRASTEVGCVARLARGRRLEDIRSAYFQQK